MLQHFTQLCLDRTAPTGLRYCPFHSGISSVLNYQIDTAGVDFSFRGRIEPQLLTFSLVLNNASYASLTVTYLLTSRPDILAGSYIAGRTSIMQTPTNSWIAIPNRPPSSPFR